MQHKHTDQTREKKPNGVHYYHAKIMEDVEDADWMQEDDTPPLREDVTKECGIYATQD